MNQFQRDRLAGREEGRRRVNQMTRATVATSAVAVALITALFAQTQASATDATATPGLTDPGTRPESAPTSAPPGISEHPVRRRHSAAPRLQPPDSAPVQSSGASSHALSGGS